MVTPADTLRRAAALMRQRAEKATPGPWHAWLDGSDVYVESNPTGHMIASLERCEDPEHQKVLREDEGDYIASWHPAVAHAVADWLEYTANTFDIRQIGDPGLGDKGIYPPMCRPAVAVARVYLGEVPDGD